MKTKNNFFKNLAVYGVSAAFLFALPACDSNRQQGALEDNGLVEEEPIAEEDGLVENEYTEVADRDFYNTWDADRSGAINEEEFNQNWENNFGDAEMEEGFFANVDLNKNAELDENEFRTGVWGYFNADNNEGLNMAEYRGINRSYYFNRWDADNNDGIIENEFKQGWNNYMGEREYDEKLFGEWDTNDDSLLDENEYATAMFGYWDEDKSGLIEEKEYAAFYR